MYYVVLKSKIHFLPVILLAIALGIYPKIKHSTTRTHVVEIKQMKFVPSALSVSRGDKVTWINKDFFPHDVTGADDSWSSRPFGQKESWSKIITEDLSYYCNLHKVMKGEIHIE